MSARTGWDSLPFYNYGWWRSEWEWHFWPLYYFSCPHSSLTPSSTVRLKGESRLRGEFAVFINSYMPASRILLLHIFAWMGGRAVTQKMGPHPKWIHPRPCCSKSGAIESSGQLPWSCYSPRDYLFWDSCLLGVNGVTLLMCFWVMACF